MTEVVKILNCMEGYALVLEGENLRVKKGKHLPNQLKKQIITYKTELIETLKRDKQAKEIGLIVAIPGTLYTLSVSKSSSLYIELINDEWHVWRETHQTGSSISVNERDIAKASNFDYVLSKVESYLMYIKKFRNQKG